MPLILQIHIMITLGGDNEQMSKETQNGYVDAVITPNWIKKNCGDIYVDDVFKPLIIFYIVNTPCQNSSYRSTDCEWAKSTWKSELGNYILGIANLQRGKTFDIANIKDLKEHCNKLFINDDFYNNLNPERIVISYDHKNKGDITYKEFLGICSHIRNSFAHGRFAIYEDTEDKENAVFVMEDYSKQEHAVSARMVLKQSTLVKWMEILQSGPEGKNFNVPKKTQNQNKPKKRSQPKAKKDR